MQRTKALALIALIGALVVGGALGFSIDRIAGRDPCRGASGRAGLHQYLAQELDLTPVQRTAVDSILDKRHRDMNAAIAPVRPALDSIRIAARGEIMKLLDGRQRPRFQRMIEESERSNAAEKR